MRVKCPVVVLGADGKAAAGVSVETLDRATGARPEEGPWTQETGSTAAANPVNSDANGKVPAWFPTVAGEVTSGRYESKWTVGGVAYVEAWDAVSGRSEGVAHEQLADRALLNLSGVSSWLALTLIDAALSVPAGVMPPQSRLEYSSDEGRVKGCVRLRGAVLVTGTLGAGGAQVALTGAHAPSFTHKQIVAHDLAGVLGTHFVTIDNTGLVQTGGSSGMLVYLDGITYALGGATT